MDDENADLEGLDEEALRDALKALRAAVRRHRDAKGHARCWLDDATLYAALPEGNTGDQRLPPREEFLAGCARYHALRQAGGGATCQRCRGVGCAGCGGTGHAGGPTEIKAPHG